MKCCGSQSPQDWLQSQWRASAPIDLLDIDAGEEWVHHVKAGKHYAVNHSIALPNVPFSCCTQMAGSTVHNLIAKSLIRCQQSGSSSKMWRHNVVRHFLNICFSKKLCVCGMWEARTDPGLWLSINNKCGFLSSFLATMLWRFRSKRLLQWFLVHN